MSKGHRSQLEEASNLNTKIFKDINELQTIGKTRNL